MQLYNQMMSRPKTNWNAKLEEFFIIILLLNGLKVIANDGRFVEYEKNVWARFEPFFLLNTKRLTIG